MVRTKKKEQDQVEMEVTEDNNQTIDLSHIKFYGMWYKRLSDGQSLECKDIIDFVISSKDILKVTRFDVETQKQTINIVNLTQVSEMIIQEL